MTAAANSGRYMSDLVKSVSPALKLMNVLTTATDASEIPVAAGIPSSRTRPDVCRTNSRVGCDAPALPDPMLHCYLSLGYLQPQHQGEDNQARAGRCSTSPNGSSG